MENELTALEGKLAQLVQFTGGLRTENIRLRQELEQVINNLRLCNEQLVEANQRNMFTNEKVEHARVRLERLLTTFPEDQD
jgi:chromosome segregation ATPase